MAQGRRRAEVVSRRATAYLGFDPRPVPNRKDVVVTCKHCGNPLPAGRKKFCSNRCKDRYHNKNNPRGYFLHLKDSGKINENPEYDWPEGWDGHKHEGL